MPLPCPPIQPTYSPRNSALLRLLVLLIATVVIVSRMMSRSRVVAPLESWDGQEDGPPRSLEITLQAEARRGLRKVS